MKKYLFMKPVLKFVSEGGLFSRVFTGALRVFGAFLVIGPNLARNAPRAPRRYTVQIALPLTCFALFAQGTA